MAGPAACTAAPLSLLIACFAATADAMDGWIHASSARSTFHAQCGTCRPAPTLRPTTLHPAAPTEQHACGAPTARSRCGCLWVRAWLLHSAGCFVVPAGVPAAERALHATCRGR